MSQQQTQKQVTLSPNPAKVRQKPRPIFLKPERIQDTLKVLHGWELATSGRALVRTREFPTPFVAQGYGNFVDALAGALGLPAEVIVIGSRVLLKLYAERQTGRTVESATEAVLGFAQHLG
jgi:hypothetical protein